MKQLKTLKIFKNQCQNLQANLQKSIKNKNRWQKKKNLMMTFMKWTGDLP